MATAPLDKAALKLAPKEALAETLQQQQQQRALFQEVFAEVLGDFALGEAIREGEKSRSAPREGAGAGRNQSLKPAWGG